MNVKIDSSEDITEEFLMTLLCQVGEARSAFMEAMMTARKGHFQQAQQLLKSGDEALTAVHKSQTALIGFDEGAGKVTMTLILTHIQDHIMTTMLCRELAEEIVAIHHKLNKVRSYEEAHI
ncbi:PTS lactose/cellobiose transporter subunit IIA [Vibrio genomosp. F10]|uniref:PTS fructose transporter subunit IIC n=2 Tax=Vibrio genomosp. F10 TaxID=723171 RepID=A0A1B9R2Y4_9VIBR|nr:PTS lactose/cellobiose transporter subunit IIA [Vibrio genomosp. F10]OCH78660.1 PTS fructose transporter subunit IIC [Vibrio genomosp. F10]OEE31277.1 PTS fructose transporter subunit IIC [Vibrio genomosp. F10 str. ZF-129]OEE89047.1 PTS fructose transporter subunit IIC [Vibrio genomosp. F10 str. 9ZD137]OEE93663.1 PTS fructose transporter subunit IIC [Vibrio genomosp. F10 str. 9ZC157]OEF07147.1 PTS fructose transporter subunit IIC [Vibrio genomosp. F10 str. 9ZB36]